MCVPVCVDTICFLLCCLTESDTPCLRPAYTIRTFKSCFSHHHLHLERRLPLVTQPHTYTYVSHTGGKLFVMSQQKIALD